MVIVVFIITLLTVVTAQAQQFCAQDYPDFCAENGFPNGYLPDKPQWCPFSDTSKSVCPNHLGCCPIDWDCGSPDGGWPVENWSLNNSVIGSYNIVFIGDGFVGGRGVSGFDEVVEEAKNAILSISPFNQFECAFNFFQVEVMSEEEGIDEPTKGLCRDTELNTGFGAVGNPDSAADDVPSQVIVAWVQERCFRAAGFATTNASLVVVFVNSDTEAGSADTKTGDVPVIFVSLGGQWKFMLAHELGHAIGGLAEEYDCYCCGGCSDNSIDDTEYDAYPTATLGEPTEPNVTTHTELSEIKWNNHINVPENLLPTDPNGSFVVPVGQIIGLFEGAGKYETGIFRPTINCLMRDLDAEKFCKVCKEAMRDEILCDALPVSTGEYLAAQMTLYWNQAKYFRWPVPLWNGMYDSPGDTIRVAIGTDLALQRVAKRISVVDPRGRRIAEGDVGADQAAISFVPDAYEPLLIEIETRDPIADRVRFYATMFINGVEHPLSD